MPSLDSARLKLERADTHLKALKEEITRFRPLSGPRVVRRSEEKSKEIVWRFQGTPILPDRSIALIVGDALYNLRSTLDHLAWSVVEVCGGEPDRMTAFPICKDEARFREEVKRRLRGMSPEAIALVEANQPYRPWRNDLFLRLWWLECLCNVDKHRHLNLIVCATAGGLFDRAIPVEYGLRGDTIYSGPVEDGTILAHVGAEQGDVQFHPLFDVSLRHEDAGQDISCSMDLPLISMRVADVVRQFEERFFTPQK